VQDHLANALAAGGVSAIGLWEEGELRDSPPANRVRLDGEPGVERVFEERGLPGPFDGLARGVSTK
jgi:hypothetical protein